MANHPTYSRELFDGIISNTEVIELDAKANELLGELRAIHNKIIELRNNCIHTYEFSSSGVYDDNYVCKICGHETEK